MFNDERINHESGRIYKNGILIATLVALIYGIFRAVYLTVTKHFVISFTEIFIVLCGGIILLVGYIRFRGGVDERTVFEKHSYYLKAGKTFLVTALSGYALSIPFATGREFSDVPVNELIIVLEVLGYIYFFWNFKSKDINFNYSFIAEDKKTYYVYVFSNIGKLAGVLAIAFSLSLVIDIFLHSSIVSFVSIIIGYATSVIGLGLEYLFISFVEKVSYDEEDTDKLKKGVFITLIALIAVTAVSAALNIWYYSIATSNLSSYPGNVSEVLTRISRLRVSFSYVVGVISAMFLCYFMTQIRKSKIATRAIRFELILSAVSICWSFVNSFMTYCVVYVIEDSVIINSILAKITLVANIFTLVSFGISMALFCGL